MDGFLSDRRVDCLAAALRSRVYGPTMVQQAGGAILYKWGVYVTTNTYFDWWEYLLSLPTIVAVSITLGILGALAGKFADGVREGLRG
jgi:hypothetical protein